MKEPYAEKFEKIAANTLLALLPEEQQVFLRTQATRHRFSQQELRRVCEIAKDLDTWREPPIQSVWPQENEAQSYNRERKKALLSSLESHWEELKVTPKTYVNFDASTTPTANRIQFNERSKGPLGLGWCPVASERTRCCNLLTLDTVENCGFDCSYCSIQSFYHGDQIHIDPQFADKLMALELDPNKTYHIGTGQSSDSLMWGNKQGVLDALMEFARTHPNVILEFKTKSKNIAYLLKNDVPPNVICTWSLNPQTIIDHEEHLTASLDERINSAKRLADKGVLVGFHFHPMIHYDSWREDYGGIFSTLLSNFESSQVALVSLGTLTFIKPVMQRIRSRDFYSKILQMPLVDADGKLSYPMETKLEMFGHAYQSLSPWHDKVFFYLCMENQTLWEPVFGKSFATNNEFEQAMKDAYLEKINQRKEAENGTTPPRIV